MGTYPVLSLSTRLPLRISRLAATLFVVALGGCAPTAEDLGTTSQATTLSTESAFGFPDVLDAYNESAAFNVGFFGDNPLHLATYTYNEPYRRLGFMTWTTGSPPQSLQHGDATTVWGPPSGVLSAPFVQYTDNAQTFAIPHLAGHFVTVTNFADANSFDPGVGYGTSGVAVVVSTDGSSQWGTPQVVVDNASCASNNGGNGCNSTPFYAQVAQDNSDLYISYYTGDPYDGYYYGWHVQKWTLDPVTQAAYHFYSEVPLPSAFHPHIAKGYFRFAVGKCAVTQGTCVQHQTVIVGVGPDDGYPPEPGVSGSRSQGPLVRHRVARWRRRLDGSRPDRQRSPPSGVHRELPELAGRGHHDGPDAPDGRVRRPHLAPGHPQRPAVRLAHRPLPDGALRHDLEPALPSGGPGRPGDGAPIGDVEYDDVAPSVLFSTNTTTETFALAHLSNEDNVRYPGTSDFGGVRVMATGLNGGAFLPPSLPPSLGFPNQLFTYDTSTSNYDNFARTIGLDTPTCGYEVLYGGSSAPFFLEPFSL